MTNLSSERTPAGNIVHLYRLRWEVELAFRANKSGCGLDELNSKDPVVVKTLVYAALLRHSLAMAARRQASGSLGKNRWLGALMWVSVFNPQL